MLALLDGQHDLREIQAELFRSYGELVAQEAIQGLVDTLDERFFLEGDVFKEFLARTAAEFARSPVRQAMLAGQAYPDDVGALSEELSGYYRSLEGRAW